ncbi:MAG TPA: DUF87 domain-containing protein [Candidatus Cybelea sp.]|jgi:hypothetical protein
MRELGRVVSVAGSRMIVDLDAKGVDVTALRVGSIVKVHSNNGHQVLGSISEVKIGENGHAAHFMVADLLGELHTDNGELTFSRGVSSHPVPGQLTTDAEEGDLRAIYGEPGGDNVQVGTLYHDPSRPAFVMTDKLLGKHFAVLGSTGSGKSCSVTVILSAILAKHPQAHVILLDPHNEYSQAFGPVANIINVENLQLPLWLLDFAEAQRLLIRSGTASEQQSQALILKDAMMAARMHFNSEEPHASSITVDTPVPYRAYELLHSINEQMGRLAKPDTALPYLRLRERLTSLLNDPRFRFFFSAEEDILEQIIGQLLRVPVNGKPLTIVDLSGVPSEVTDVIVSTLSRVIFNFGVWAERDKTPPLLLVCEEAQRYVPADESLGFEETVRVITQIAKEGRKYGMSLALITQRPTELSLSVLSQCGTVFALRLGSEADQDFISRTLPDAARDMLAALPSLPGQQAIVSGEGVIVPMRIRFSDLPPDRRPRSEGAAFSKAWQSEGVDEEFVKNGIRRWRERIRS